MTTIDERGKSVMAMTETYTVDVDVHPVLDPARIPDFLSEPHRTRYISGDHGPGVLGYWNPNGVRRQDAVLTGGLEIANDPRSLLQQFMEPHGINACVLNVDGPFFVMSPDRGFGAALAAASNDLLAADWLAYDKRLRASILVSVADPARAAAEIRRVGNNQGFVQVLLPSSAQMPYGNPFYHPIYEAAADLNLPIALHIGFEGIGLSGQPTACGYPGTYLEWHTGLFTNSMTHLISMICEGTFHRFRSLKCILIEAGISWLPSLMWRFDKNWKGLRSLTPWLDAPPSEVISRHILLTTQPLEEPPQASHLHQVMEMFDAENMLMFASDYPHWDGDYPDFVGQALPEQIRSRVLGLNAMRVYRGMADLL